MKRSEMVKTIKDFFYNNDFYNFDDEHADPLLSKLENAGMQPPPVLYEGKFGPIFYNDREGEE
jgi:hypothetical protein